MKKRIILTIACLTTIASFTAKPIYAYGAQEVADSDETIEVQPRQDILEWIYKTFNGKLYKRLWNASKGEWLTDWILEE